MPTLAARFTRLHRAGFALAGAGALVASCTVSGPADIASAGDAVPAGAEIAITPPREGSAFETGFANALATELAARNMTIAPEGRFVVFYGIATRDASAAIYASTAGSDAAELSSTRKNLLLDECRAQRVRATVTVLDKSSGSTRVRTSIDLNDCGYSSQTTAELAARAAAAIAGV